MSKKKRNILIAIIIIIGIIIIGICNMPPAASKKVSEFGGISTTIKQYPEIIDGKNVGTYSIADYDAKTTTDEQVLNYYNKKIKGRKDNYFLLVDGNQTILFAVCTIQGGITKGSYDEKTHTLGTFEYNGIVSGDTIKWSKAVPQ